MLIVKNKRNIDKLIHKSKSIFLMAHRDLDLDALGSCVGLFILLKKKKKNCYIIIDDKNHELGVEKVLLELEGCITIIKSSDLATYLYPKDNKNLLIILDTNKSELVQSEEVLTKISRKIIIDHHDEGKTTIPSDLSILDLEVSSTCEMITSLIEINDLELEPYYATILLSGIVLDTNNFTLKTSSETYYSAYYLSCLGASAKKVQYLLKQDIEDYTERQKLLTSIETLYDNIAFTKGSPYTVYRREDLAKTADTLLFFNGIEASFVIGKIGKNITGISARSLGNFDISKILEKLGGGGDNYNGAAKFENSSISKVEAQLKKILEEEEAK